MAEITNDIYQKYHKEVVTCAVCNQFTNVSHTKLLAVQQFQKKMCAILKTPDGSGWAKKLHPTLAKQYDISEFFPEHLEVKNILLSPNGVVRHVQSCVSGENCQCIPNVFQCAKCIFAIKLVALVCNAYKWGNYQNFLLLMETELGSFRLSCVKCLMVH